MKNTQPQITPWFTGQLTGFVFCFMIATLLLSIVGSSALQAQERRERREFDFGSYLAKKDANRNGRIEPEELSSNARNIIRKMGFDDTKSNSIKQIVAKAEKGKADRAKAASTSSKTTRERKVPGFGSSEKKERVGVSRFGATAAATGTKAVAKAPPSESVVKRVDSTLGRYDFNKDGKLDKNEISKARWGSPSPEQSDTNRDGQLSRDELIVRYSAREEAYKTVSTSRSKTSTRSKERSFRPASGSSTRASSPRSSSKSSSSGSSSSSSGSQAKYERYAESLVKQYDEDKDGKLSSDEIKKMRRPPIGADADKDGFITKSELVGSLNVGAKPAADSKSSPSKDKDGGRSRSKSRDSKKSYSSSKSSRGSSSSFEKLDADGDRHIQMHEFSDKWSDAIVDEYYEKDKNRDGVITLKEWAGG